MGTYGGSSQAWYVQVLPSEPTLVLGTLALSAPTVQGGGQVTGTVTFSGIGFVPGPGGAIVHLGSTNPAVASVPASVTVPQGASSATFTITTTGVSSNTPVTIIATRSSMQTKVLEVLPTGGLSAIAFNPDPAVGSGGSTGTVTLGGPAPAGGTVVSLSSSDTRWVRVPATVTVPAGATSVTFTAATTSDPTQGQFASISATAGGIERFATLHVNPPPPGGDPGQTLSSVSVSPNPVTGGGSGSGTVTMTGSVSAPATVTLTSSNPSVVTVPGTSTVPAGSSSRSFTVITSTVASATAVTITASNGGVTRTTTLTVNPPGGGGGGGGTLPAPTLSSPGTDARVNSPVTFDWSDVAGAASYVLEIDDSSSFSNPLTRSVTSTPSTATVTGLPSRRLWWRVRAIGPTGTPGTTSGSRRFEVR
jgi:hypothetical protein